MGRVRNSHSHAGSASKQGYHTKRPSISFNPPYPTHEGEGVMESQPIPRESMLLPRYSQNVIDLTNVQSVVRQQRQASLSRPNVRFVTRLGPARLVAGAICQSKYIEGIDEEVGIEK